MEKKEQNIGVAWEQKFENSPKAKFNLSIDVEKFKDLPANKQGEVKLKVEKNDVESDNKKSPTHTIKFNDYKSGDEKKENEDLFVNVNKDALLKTVGEEKQVVLEAGAKRNDSVGVDRADYYVRSKDEEGNNNYVGRAWSPNQIVDKKEYVGVAFKKDFDDGGKAYNLSLNKDELGKMKADDYGNIRVSIAERKEQKEGHPSHSVYQSIGKEPYKEATISLNKEKTMNLPADDYGNIKVSAVDKLNIGKDKADLVAFENTGKKEETKNFIGSGWSNKPELIRVNEKDKTPDGLSVAIANNHTAKVQAILQKAPKAIRKSHVNLINDMAKKGESLDKSLNTMVNNAYDASRAQKKGVKM